MKTFIIVLVFLFHFILPIKSNDNLVEYNIIEVVSNKFGILYKDLGVATNHISDDEIITIAVKVYKREINSQTQKSFKSFGDDKMYRYNIVCISESTFNGELTSTWLFGFWVKINGVLITRPIYPNGKDMMIYTTPTIAHYIETHEENIKINVGWSESVYEPKIIK